MNIALIGYGKMGKTIEALSAGEGVNIVSIIDPSFNNSLSQESVSEAEICIDFTHPDSVIDNIRKASALGKSLVVGTTGWYEHLESVKQWIEENGTALLYSPNFSIGIYFFQKIVSYAASLCLPSGNYAVGGIEAHHQQKADAPSGTARSLATAIAREGKIAPSQIPFASLRCGTIPGTHTIYFDSPADTITLTHQARDRSDFARGAITAARWLRGRKGVFTIQDMLETIHKV